MTYRVIIDPNGSATVLVDEPFGLKELSITVERDDSLKGIFQIYTSTLDFWGDGFTLLLAALNTAAASQEIRIEKINDDGDVTLTFDGILYAATARIDTVRQSIKTKIDNNNLSTTIKKLSKTSVGLDQISTIAGSALSITSLTTTFHNFTAGTAKAGVTTYLISDVIQFLLSYISDNEIDFDSTFLETTVGVIDKYDIDFVGTMVAGDKINFAWDNFSSATIAISTNFSVDMNTTLGIFAASLFTYTAGADKEFAQNLNPYFLTNADQISAAQVTIESFMPITNIVDSINPNVGGTTITTNQTQAHVNGFARVAITNGFQLSGNNTNRVPALSFEEVLKELNKYADFTIIPKIVGGVPTVEIKLTEDAYDTATTLMTLDNIKYTPFEFNTDYHKSAIDLSNGVNNQQSHKRESVGTTAGIGDVFDLNSEWIVEPGAIVETADGTIDTHDEEKIFMFELNPGDDNTKQYRLFSESSGSRESFSYNAMLTNSARIVNHFFSVNADTFFIDTGIGAANTSALRINKNHDFNWTITDTQIAALLANPEGKILFSNTDANHTTGFVNKIDINVTTLETNYNLQSE